VITRGAGRMPGYAAQITADQRWQLVHYVQALQQGARP
jgi:mono/diheme cytochrome c family protein